MRTEMTEATSARSSPRPRISRRWLIRLLAAFAGIVVVLGVLETIEWPFLRQPVESALRRALARDVSIGPDFGVRFIGPLRLRTDLLVVGPAPDGPTVDDLRGQNRDLLRASGVRLAVPWTTVFALLRRQDPADAATRPPPVIDSLEVARLEAALARDADGRANWRFGPQEERRPLVLPEFGRLAMTSGEILLDDALMRLRLEAAVRTQEGAVAEPATERAAAGLDIAARGTYRGQALVAHLHSSGLLPLADAGMSSPPVPLRLEVRLGSAQLDFEGSGRDVLHLAALSGKFRLSGPSLASAGDAVGVTLPTTGPFTMHGHAAKDGAVWTADIREFEVGRSQLNGSFRFDPTRRVPKLSGRLGGARLSLLDLGPAVGTTPPAPGPGAKRATARPASTRVAGPRVLPQREFDIPSLAAMDADVHIALDQFDLGTAQLDKLAPFKAHAVLENQVLTFGDLVARASGGEVRGLLSVDARPEKPLWRADIRWSGVELERFVKPRNPTERTRAGAKRTGTGELPGYVSGHLGGRARVHGSGRSTAQVLATLSGEAQLWVRNGRISHLLVEASGLDIAQALGMVVRGDEQLPMQCAVAGLNVRDGKVWPEAAVIETSDSTLRIGGVVSLADERLGLVFKALPKDKSPLTLRSPLFIEGTFANPEVRLDTSSIGARLAASAALAAAAPIAALLALFDLGEPEKEVCQEAFQRVSRFAGNAAAQAAAGPRAKENSSTAASRVPGARNSSGNGAAMPATPRRASSSTPTITTGVPSRYAIWIATTSRESGTAKRSSPTSSISGAAGA